MGDNSCSSPAESNEQWPREVKEPDTSNFHTGLYSPSQFDLMRILARVARRPNPQVNLGPIDCNAAIIVCDTSLDDSPIVYCSEAFCDLTGYEHGEIIGRNCRFLQSPGVNNLSPDSHGRDQKVPVPGASDQTIDLKQELSRMKDSLSRNEEVQVVVRNYTKLGTAFLNLVTIVPLEPEHGEHAYFVGFQANSISAEIGANVLDPS